MQAAKKSPNWKVSRSMKLNNSRKDFLFPFKGEKNRESAQFALKVTYIRSM
jgi:hypothetical protein